MARIHLCALAALPVGLLLAGCANDHPETRPAQTAYTPARSPSRIVGESTGPHVMAQGETPPATQPDQMLGYTIAPQPRYDVTLDEIRSGVQSNSAVIVDARGPAAFKRGHVRSAINLPAGQTEAYFQQFSQQVSPGQLIILYCNGPHCDSADMVYEFLAARGYSNMRVFRPGWETLSTASDLR